MAKRNKNQFDFAAFVKELSQNQTERSTETQAERQYFLIVCEGEKTEPNYFNSLIDTLPPDLVKVEIIGEGTNTIDVVEKGIELRDKRKEEVLQPPFDEVWAVFDKDDFPNERFNAAVTLGEQEQIHTAYSNEAFELWYILHFQLLDSAISRSVYIDILKGILGNYQKNDESIYQRLQEEGNEEQAIKHAKHLLETLAEGNPAIEKPTTKVHQLVGRLNEFKPID
ncbi:MAG: RloB family protein [Bacteroidota bacterium]